MRSPAVVPDSAVRLDFRESEGYAGHREAGLGTVVVSDALARLLISQSLSQLVGIVQGLCHIHDLDVVHRRLEFVRMSSLQEPVTHKLLGNCRGRPRWYISYIGLLAILLGSPFQSDWVSNEYAAIAHPDYFRTWTL